MLLFTSIIIPSNTYLALNPIPAIMFADDENNFDETDVVRIATNYGIEQVNEPRITSDIEKIAAEINAHPRGGLFIRDKKKGFLHNLGL